MKLPPPNTIDSETKYRAWAKAKILTKAMNECAREGIDPVAQALFAHLLAESWPEPSAQGCWSARLPMSELERRLHRTRNTIRRAIGELESIELIRTVTGHSRRTSRYVIPIYESTQTTTLDTVWKPDREGEPTPPQRVSPLTLRG